MTDNGSIYDYDNANNDNKENKPSNTSNNKPFSDLLKTNLSRRKILQGSLAAAATTFLAPSTLATGQYRNKRWQQQPKQLVDFKPLAIEAAIANNKVPSISDDYQYQVLIPWGTPLQPNTTEEYTGDPNSRPNPKQAAQQIGIGHDGMWFFPENNPYYKYRRYGYQLNSSRGMLCVNHEFGSNPHVLGKDSPESIEDVRLAQNVLGISVVAIGKNYYNNSWQTFNSKNSRRITVNTPVDFSGPAANSPLMQNPNGNIALGTLNNCGAGKTPWGTYLTCEENFNGYFGATEGESFNDKRTAAQRRYGLDFDGFNYGWEFFDKRFDLSDPDYINEANRFGWIVEIDPFDANQKPVKRTGLGRIKHEAIAIAESSNGQIAAYMGDDQRFDYCYKYVSDNAWESSIAEGKSPLDKGTLYAAQFNENGTGRWLALTIDNPLLTERFTDQGELLINTRIAADILGATPMDRPEWTTIGKDGEIYWTLTNNTRRTADQTNAANPEGPNSDGHIIRMENSDEHLGNTFMWEIFILASSTRETEQTFSAPDAAYADAQGRLFIATDGGQTDGLQDQLVVFDTHQEKPQPARLLTGVNGDEITGFTITPDQRTAFVNIQHPGNGNPLETNFPAEADDFTIPRDCTLVITRKDGGVIGS